MRKGFVSIKVLKWNVMNQIFSYDFLFVKVLSRSKFSNVMTLSK